jgi:predicted O-linked N-acetylglucosamine transferase (SPINDLY family)
MLTAGRLVGGAAALSAALESHPDLLVRNSPLFDTARFTRALDDCYVQMCVRYRAGLPPAPIEASSD